MYSESNKIERRVSRYLRPVFFHKSDDSNPVQPNAQTSNLAFVATDPCLCVHFRNAPSKQYTKAQIIPKLHPCLHSCAAGISYLSSPKYQVTSPGQHPAHCRV